MPVNRFNGVVINTASTILGRTGCSAVFGQSVSAAGGTPVMLASANAASATSATTAAVNTTGANFLVAATTYYSTATGVTLTDSKTNTWTARLERSNGAGIRQRLYYVQGGTVGTLHTFTLAGTNLFGSVQVYAFSNIAAAPFDTDVFNSTSLTWTTLATGSLTPVQSNVLLIANASWGGVSGSGITADSGMSAAVVSPWVDTVNFGGAIAYKVISNGAAHNVTWTPGGTANEGIVGLASFKY